MILILSIWAILLSWYARVLPFIGQSGMTSGYGVIHDWPRFHLVNTGFSNNVPDGLTLVSDRIYRPKDIMTFLLATISLVTGTTKLIPGLKLLQTLPNLAYFLPAFLGVSFYNRNNEQMNSTDTMFIFLSGLFLSFTFIAYTTTSINKAGYGICLLSLCLYLMYRISKIGIEQRWLIILLLLFGVMTSVYHTQSLVAIYIIPGFYFIEYMFQRFASSGNIRYNSQSSLYLLLSSLVIMIPVGMYHSGTIQEIVLNIVNIFFSSTGGQDIITSEKTSVIKSGLFYGIPASSVSKIILRSVYAILIIYLLIKLFRKYQNHYGEEERFLSILLFLYPGVLFMFYSYGGLFIGFKRTIATGSAVSIFIISYLVSEENHLTRRHILKAGLVLIVISTLVAQAATIEGEESHTEQELAAIQFTGEQVQNSKIIFTESTIGTPLLYYNQRGIVYTRPLHSGWENRMQEIYLQSNPQDSEKAILESIDRQRLQYPSIQPIDDYYVFTTKRLSKRGINLLSFTYAKKPPRQFYNNFDSNYNRVYHSGDGLLYDN